MAVRVADTIKPMGAGEFPVAEAENLVIETDHTLHTKKTIQKLYDDKELGGLKDPEAAGKMLVSKAATAPATGYVWAEVDADNDELGNSAGYQTGSDVSTAIGTALSTVFGANYASGDITAESITLTSASPSHEVVISPNGITIDTIQVATINDVTGVAWTTTVVSGDLPNPGQERVLYLKSSGGTTPDIYDEYVWVVVDSSTTPATYGYEKIGSTQLSMSASDITYTNVSQPGVTNVAASLDQVITDLATLNAAIDLVIKSYTVSPATLNFEKGSTIAAESLTFTWSINKPLTALTFDGTSVATSSTTGTNASAVSSSKTFTLTATAGSQTASKSITFNFYDSVYWGSSVTGTYNSAFVRALSNSALKANYKGSYALTVATNEYGFIAFPSSMNAPAQCKIGGFDTEMELAGTFNVTNASGATAEYKLYKTTNPSLGTITFVYE